MSYIVSHGLHLRMSKQRTLNRLSADNVDIDRMPDLLCDMFQEYSGEFNDFSAARSDRSMSDLALIGAEVLAVTVLVMGLYFPRHRRRDLVVAYFGVNIGVLAVADALRSTDGGAGLGLGFALFGVLSIIRLRSTELDQHEVAYFSPPSPSACLARSTPHRSGET